VRRSIECYEHALRITQETGDRAGEGFNLTGLGNAYSALGESRRSIEFYEQALRITQETGNRAGEGGNLTGLGNAYSALGEVRRSIEFYEQALNISQETGDRVSESVNLNNLGEASGALGKVPRAIEFYEQALTINRDIGRRQGEALTLIGLATAYADAGDWPKALRDAERGIGIADEMGLAQGSSEGRVLLAIAHLHTGDLGLAQAVARGAGEYGYVPLRDNIALVLGIAYLRDGQLDAASTAFRDALAAADGLLAQTEDSYDELDNRALALCGLALPHNSDHVREAIAAFRAARGITRAEGIVARVLRLFDSLARSDEIGILATARAAAAGET
jgi:tetratricopeptide (TPR) repeat protein